MKAFNTPIARNTDPETSHAAAREYQPRRGTDCERLLRGLRRHDGIYMTTAEIAVDLMTKAENMLWGKWKNIYHAARMPSRRMPDLERAGFVESVVVRCSVSGRDARGWTITDKGRKWLKDIDDGKI